MVDTHRAPVHSHGINDRLADVAVSNKRTGVRRRNQFAGLQFSTTTPALPEQQNNPPNPGAETPQGGVEALSRVGPGSHQGGILRRDSRRLLAGEVGHDLDKGMI